VEDQAANEAAAGKPGKVRTWWHPLLAGLLRWQLGRHYQLQEEVPVGQKPLLIDLLLVLAPRLTGPYREELRVLGVTPRQEKLGIWELEGGVVSHRTWLLETAELAGLEHPLLTLFSPRLLNQGPQTYALLPQGGYTELTV
jgi:hypothetical protein